MLKRLMAETPKFWKNIQIFGVILATISGSLIASPLEMSEDWHEFLKYLITIGGTLAGIGQFAKEDNNEIGLKED